MTDATLTHDERRNVVHALLIAYEFVLRKMPHSAGPIPALWADEAVAMLRKIGVDEYFIPAFFAYASSRSYEFAPAYAAKSWLP